MARIFDNWLDAYVDYTEDSEPSRLYRKWVGISTIAAVLKRKTWLSLWTKIYPNFYIVLVGPSGARKGTAMNQAAPMLQTLNINMAAEALTREALIREMSKATDSYITDANETYHHCSLTVFAEELAVFLGQNNIQLLSDLTDWFDCKSVWTYRTKNMGTDVIEGVWLNLLGAITPGILRNSLPQDAIGGGLTSRIIFIYAPGLEKPVPLSELDPDRQVDLIKDLEEIGLIAGEFKLEENFIDYYSEWYIKNTMNPPFKIEHFEGYNQRKALHTLKLSMITSVAKSNRMVITIEDFKEANRLMTEAERLMPNVFEGYGRRENADLIPQLMNAIMGNKVISRRELMGMFMAELTFQQLDDIIDTLSEIGFCKKIISQDGLVEVKYLEEK